MDRGRHQVVLDKGWQSTLLLATTFVASFLLFQVQPMIGKMILPWFGGSSSVWTMCLLFFQVALFAGYAYTHLSTTYLPRRSQLILHAILYVVALAILPIIPRESLKSIAADYPEFQVIVVLAATVGLPFFLLSTTAPLLQRWWTILVNDAPYHLYAISNIGSLLALISYSFLVERHLGTRLQAITWSALFALLAVLMAWCGARVWRVGEDQEPERPESVLPETSAADSARADADAGNSSAPGSDISWSMRFIWMGLSALGTGLLSAITNHLCQGMSSMPLLWIVPLTLYLLTFIICFGQRNLYRRAWMIPLMVLGQIFAAAGFVHQGDLFSTFTTILINWGTFFATCLVCHGELERLKPKPQYLTAYFLYLSAGGALGGMFVALLAPHLFTHFDELPLLMVAAMVATMLILFFHPSSTMYRGRKSWLWTLLMIFSIIPSIQWYRGTRYRHGNALVSMRNFYGVLRVSQRPTLRGPYRYFISGDTLHGGQYLSDELRAEPISYFGPHSGLAKAFEFVADRPQRRVGVLGLGIGTIAAYAQPGDAFRFYEINPLVVPIAMDYFEYLRILDERGARATIAVGDGRNRLAAEESHQFDVLILDAFTGGSPPFHLLTREAFELYLRHLRGDGYLAVNISNQYLDLRPALRYLAGEFNLEYVFISSEGQKEMELHQASWVLLRHSGNTTGPADDKIKFVPAKELDPHRVAWTDDRNCLLDVLRSYNELAEDFYVVSSDDQTAQP